MKIVIVNTLLPTSIRWSPSQSSQTAIPRIVSRTTKVGISQASRCGEPPLEDFAKALINLRLAAAAEATSLAVREGRLVAADGEVGVAAAALDAAARSAVRVAGALAGHELRSVDAHVVGSLGIVRGDGRTGSSSSALRVPGTTTLSIATGASLGVTAGSALGVACSSGRLGVAGGGNPGSGGVVSVASLARGSDDSGDGEGEEGDDAVRDHFDCGVGGQSSYIIRIKVLSKIEWTPGLTSE